ncbi:glycosyltransferase family 2 protein [Agarivorans sp. TSD2052]|uniref:glycosyltransferase family 2 protein n=1 Tax=Agarivorans sp. TSD2052 TaxID=2937286 RepID=UPI0020104DFE|nr:glycosyltransferase family 2 protein [Agarivorans sp. TSD2052]UPW20075.1 glycosyltransferase family 2 protein [Agarivorans sp. TSD2052]
MSLLQNSSPKPKVKIIAVAKDEAAYLPEWVFHHLNVGFDAIDIYINRTSDNTDAIAKKIQESFSNVRFFNADWVDFCPDQVKKNIQYVVYSKAFYEEVKADEFDYIFYLDIDEFWMSNDSVSSIQDFIIANDFPDTLSFQWINEYGGQQPFQTLKGEINGALHPLVKTAVKINCNMKAMGFHFPLLHSGRSVLCDGTKFRSDPKLRECLHSRLHQVRAAMVVHRMFRSPMEYVSLLNRGRPSDKLNIKLNRSGYNFSLGEDVSFVTEQVNAKSYSSKLDAFISDLEPELSISREFVKSRYNNCLSSISSVPLIYALDLLRVFRGCTEREFSHVIKSITNASNLKQCKSAEALRDLAVALESIDLAASLRVMEQALVVRPGGPMIMNKIASYRKTLNL